MGSSPTSDIRGVNKLKNNHMKAPIKYPVLKPEFKGFMNSLNVVLRKLGFEKEHFSTADASKYGYKWVKNVYKKHPHYDEKLIALLNEESTKTINTLKEYDFTEKFINVFHSDTHVIISFDFNNVGYIKEKYHFELV